jgi:hypothetical protein
MLMHSDVLWPLAAIALLALLPLLIEYIARRWRSTHH